MINYTDLLTAQYNENGRYSKDNQIQQLDCYGLVLELCKRNNKPIKDSLYTDEEQNLKEIPIEEIEFGDIIQVFWENSTHLAFVLDNQYCLQMTQTGARKTPIFHFYKKKAFRIV